jgi:3-oxoacyl-[acyl-carrier protein] reductase
MSGRVAIVVGAGGGLGSACVHRLAADGYLVAACDLDRGKLAAATESLATPCFLQEMNVTEEQSVTSAFGTIESSIGPAACLICCAGGTLVTQDRQVSIAETPLSDWIATEALNGRGSFLCTREMLRRRSARPIPGGRIVLVSSAAAQRPAIAAGAAYAAAKAGVIALARVAAIEAAPLGMTVNVIAPGGFDTAAYHVATTPGQMDKQIAGIPVGRLGQPMEFAALVSFLVSEQASYLTGATIDLNGGSRMA